jgi:hypothetical protein
MTKTASLLPSPMTAATAIEEMMATNGTTGGRVASQAATTTGSTATSPGRKTVPNRDAAAADRTIE